MNPVRYSEKFSIEQPVEAVFPLFSPEGEKLWVPGWDYANVVGSTDLQEDQVFTTKNHDHAGTDAIWLVKRYEPEDFSVQFYRVEPEDKVGVVSVRCSRTEGEATEVEITYQYTALGQKGARFIEGFTPGEYKEFIAEWKRLLLRYFASLSR